MTIHHPYYDIEIDLDHYGACLRFGAQIRDDEIPLDGEIIRAGGQLYRVGIMDTSDPPMLTMVTDASDDTGIWWDADVDAESV